MRELRRNLMIAGGSLALLVGFEHVYASPGVVPVASWSALLWMVLVLAWPTLRAAPARLVCGGAAAFALVLGLALPGSREGLPLLVALAALVAGCVHAARRVAHGIDDFEATAERLLLEGLPGMPEFGGDAERRMQQEMRRARSHERPLSLMTIAPPALASDEMLSGFAHEMQRRSSQRYVLGRVAAVLADAMRDPDIVAVRDDHFVILLPETTGAEADALAARIQELCRDALRLEVKIGTASFPDQEVTFRRLLEDAVDSMRGALPGRGDGDDTPMPEQWRPERRGGAR